MLLTLFITALISTFITANPYFAYPPQKSPPVYAIANVNSNSAETLAKYQTTESMNSTDADTYTSTETSTSENSTTSDNESQTESSATEEYTSETTESEYNTTDTTEYEETSTAYYEDQYPPKKSKYLIPCCASRFAGRTYEKVCTFFCKYKCYDKGFNGGTCTEDKCNCNGPLVIVPKFTTYKVASATTCTTCDSNESAEAQEGYGYDAAVDTQQENPYQEDAQDTYPAEDADHYPEKDADHYPVKDADHYSAEDAGPYSAEDADHYPAEDADHYPAEGADHYPAEDTGDHYR